MWAIQCMVIFEEKGLMLNFQTEACGLRLVNLRLGCVIMENVAV